jgi:hypothetical protein
MNTSVFSPDVRELLDFDEPELGVEEGPTGGAAGMIKGISKTVRVGGMVGQFIGDGKIGIIAKNAGSITKRLAKTGDPRDIKLKQVDNYVGDATGALVAYYSPYSNKYANIALSFVAEFVAESITRYAVNHFAGGYSKDTTFGEILEGQQSRMAGAAAVSKLGEMGFNGVMNEDALAVSTQYGLTKELDRRSFFQNTFKDQYVVEHMDRYTKASYIDAEKQEAVAKEFDAKMEKKADKPEEYEKLSDAQIKEMRAQHMKDKQSSYVIKNENVMTQEEAYKKLEIEAAQAFTEKYPANETHYTLITRDEYIKRELGVDNIKRKGQKEKALVLGQQYDDLIIEYQSSLEKYSALETEQEKQAFLAEKIAQSGHETSAANGMAIASITGAGLTASSEVPQIADNARYQPSYEGRMRNMEENLISVRQEMHNVENQQYMTAYATMMTVEEKVERNGKEEYRFEQSGGRINNNAQKFDETVAKYESMFKRMTKEQQAEVIEETIQYGKNIHESERLHQTGLRQVMRNNIQKPIKRLGELQNQEKEIEAAIYAEHKLYTEHEYGVRHISTKPVLDQANEKREQLKQEYLAQNNTVTFETQEVHNRGSLPKDDNLTAAKQQADQLGVNTQWFDPNAFGQATINKARNTNLQTPEVDLVKVRAKQMQLGSGITEEKIGNWDDKPGISNKEEALLGHLAAEAQQGISLSDEANRKIQEFLPGSQVNTLMQQFKNLASSLQFETPGNIAPNGGITGAPAVRERQ